MVKLQIVIRTKNNPRTKRYALKFYKAELHVGPEGFNGNIALDYSRVIEVIKNIPAIKDMKEYYRANWGLEFLEDRTLNY